VNRREFLRRVAMASAFLVIGAAGVVELVEKVAPAQSAVVLTSQTSQTTVVSTTTPQGYLYVGKVADLGGATSAYFTHPSYGNSILLLVGGVWKAFTATCTHQVCTVQYRNAEIYCPCHGGTFNPSNGAVTGGPPPSPLTEFAVLVQGGVIYVSSTAT
jgi:Rieske Fe-S protein